VSRQCCEPPVLWSLELRASVKMQFHLAFLAEDVSLIEESMVVASVISKLCTHRFMISVQVIPVEASFFTIEVLPYDIIQDVPSKPPCFWWLFGGQSQVVWMTEILLQYSRLSRAWCSHLILVLC
jgi:hypothetical protein